MQHYLYGQLQACGRALDSLEICIHLTQGDLQLTDLQALLRDGLVLFLLCCARHFAAAGQFRLFCRRRFERGPKFTYFQIKLGFVFVS